MNLNKSMGAFHPSLPQSHERSIAELLSRLVLSIMLPLLAFSGLVLWQFSQQQQHRADKEALLTASALAKDVDREVTGFTAALVGLSSSPALQSGDLATFYEQVHQVAALIRAPILLEEAKSGRQLLNTRRPFGAELPNSEPSQVFKTVSATKRPYVSDLIFGLVAQRNLIVVAVPVMQDGEVTSVLMASVEPERLIDVISDPQWGDDAIAEISDRNGIIITRSRDFAKFSGYPSGLFGEVAGSQDVARVDNIAGERVLRGYRGTEQGWRVAAFRPIRSIEAPLRQSWLAFVAIGVGVLALALPLTLHYAGLIARSIRDVASRAAALGRGEVVPLLETDILEAAKVAAALNAASITLHERTRLLAESAARFRSAFEQAAVGFEQTSLDGRWLSLNNRFCELVGYSREECLELSPAELTHPEDLLVETPLLERVLRGDLPSASIEKRYHKKGGGVVWVRSTTSLVRDPEGSALYRVSVVEDITSGHDARAVTARLAALVQASNDAIISIRPGGLIDTWNPGAERLFGYTEAEVLGQPVGILNPATQQTEASTPFERGFAGESFRIETLMRRNDNTLIEVALSVSPISTKAGTEPALSVMIEDIRDRREWERQLLLLNRELQHRVKNSLAVVQSIANQTLRSSPGPEGFRKAFQGRLQALAAANDLLLQSAWTGSDLEGIIDQQLKPLLSDPGKQLQKRGTSVRLPADLTVPLGLALHELGTNALKYGSLSADCGRIEIEWTVTERDEHRELVLSWKETGGPAATPGEHRGFGSTLILRGIPGAVVDHRIEPGGVVCTMTLVLDIMVPENQQAIAQR